MTAQSAIPLKWYVPFANGDSARVELPVTTADPTRASQTLGFPPLTMQPPESGGVPPQGEDFNGGMNQIARIAWWVLNGGGWPFDATFATNSNINGYPNGATLQSADFRGDWLSIADNNQNNPDTNGTNWVPGFHYGVTNLTGLTGGTFTPTNAQAAKNSITLAGTLTSALTVFLPTWTKNWTITNSTTGAFVTIVKTAAGSGVTIPQTGQPTRVSGDGTNIVQAPENVAAATQSTNPLQLGQLGGGQYLGTQILTAASGTINPGVYTIGGRSVTATQWCVRGVAGGGAGGGAGATAAGAISLGTGGQAGAEVEFYMTAAATPYTVGAAGTAGAAGAAGNTGGNSTFGTAGAIATLPGGVGGSVAGPAAAPFSQTTPGASGAPTGSATFTYAKAGSLVGTPVNPGANGSLLSGYGADSAFGTGGNGTAGGAGVAGSGYGSGGGGAANPPSTAARAGGPGLPGVWIVAEFA